MGGVQGAFIQPFDMSEACQLQRNVWDSVLSDREESYLTDFWGGNGFHFIAPKTLNIFRYAFKLLWKSINHVVNHIYYFT